MKKTVFLVTLVLGSNVLFTPHVLANTAYEVFIVNLTRGQVFSPAFLVSHNPDVQLFTSGAEASEGMTLLAEEGDSSVLTNELSASDNVYQVVNDTAPIPPGGTSTLTIYTRGDKKYISLAGMLVSTNDAFYALNRVRVPRNGSETYLVPAYDAGTEGNDEQCENIPGPCDADPGTAEKPEGEGYIHIQAGIHGIGGLNAAERDWRNPVARITVKRVAPVQ